MSADAFRRYFLLYFAKDTRYTPLMLKNTAAASETFDFDMFAAPVVYPERETLRGTGPRGLVRDDRLVADADNARVNRGPRRKR